MEKLHEIIIDLLLENKDLKKEIKNGKESLSFWYKEYDSIKNELESLKKAIER